MSVYYDIFRNPIPVNNTTTYRMYKLASRNKRNGAALNSISNSKGRYVMSNGYKAKLVSKPNNKNMNTWNWNNTKKNNNNNNNNNKNVNRKNNIKNVPLPKNIDPVSHENFKLGSAVMITKNGYKFFLTKESAVKLAKFAKNGIFNTNKKSNNEYNKEWNTILNNLKKNPRIVFKNPLTQADVTRFQLKKVKFVKNKNS
jgi:hypothetical protein